MRTLYIDRRLLGLVGLAVVGAAIWAFRHLDADRGLALAWEELLDAVESRKPARFGDLLATDYADRWGHARETIVRDARAAFLQFRRLELIADQVEIRRDDDRATITALVRMEADGTGQVAEARAIVNGLFTPFTFEWRREPGFPWSWKLVRFDHPELNLARFRSHGWGGP